MSLFEKGHPTSPSRVLAAILLPLTFALAACGGGAASSDTAATDNAETRNTVKEVFKNLAARLGETVYTGETFDYWPQGGLRNCYEHTASITSYSTLSELLPHSIFLSGPHSAESLDLKNKSQFGHYNPKFIAYVAGIAKELLADDAFVNSTRPLLDQTIGDQVIMLWQCYNHLQADPFTKTLLVGEYEGHLEAGAVPDEFFYKDWSSDQYLFMHDLEVYDRVDINVLGSFTFFWLRRHMDGTEEAIHAMLTDIVSAYYPEFLYETPY